MSVVCASTFATHVLRSLRCQIKIWEFMALKSKRIKYGRSCFCFTSLPLSFLSHRSLPLSSIASPSFIPFFSLPPSLSTLRSIPLSFSLLSHLLAFSPLAFPSISFLLVSLIFLLFPSLPVSPSIFPGTGDG